MTLTATTVDGDGDGDDRMARTWHRAVTRGQLSNLTREQLGAHPRFAALLAELLLLAGDDGDAVRHATGDADRPTDAFAAGG